MTLPLAFSLHRMPFRAPWLSRRGATRERWSLLVTAGEGEAVGYGEAALPLRGSDAQEVARTALAGVPALGLDDMAALRQATRDVPGWLRHGIVCAALDRSARQAVEPFGRHLLRVLDVAPVARPPAVVAVNGNIGPVAPADAAAAARRLTAAGFGTLKVKSLGDVREDAERLRAIRAAVGDRVRLRLDANGAWSLDAASAALETLAPFDLEYVEQPVAVGDAEAAAALVAESPVPVAWDESVTDADAADRLLAAGCAALVVKPPRLGGPDRFVAVADSAARHGAACVVSTPLEGAVGRTVDLHLAALSGGSLAHGLATEAILEHDYAEPAPRAERGAVPLPSGAGLGPRFRFRAGEPVPWGAGS